MPAKPTALTCALFGTALLSVWLPIAWTQQPQPTKKQKTGTASSLVVIERQSLRLIDPAAYQVPLRLQPVQFVELTAAVEGVVQSVHVKAGQKVDVQIEAVRLESKELQLKLRRASANNKVAQIELKQAKTKNEAEAIELTQAKLEAAQAELGLAKLQVDRTSIRVPFAGTVFRVNVAPGQFVRVGDPLLSVGDTSRMKVEVPVDRQSSTAGKTIELRIEDKTIQAKVGKVLPLSDRFEPLRALANSLGSAIIVIDNRDGRFHAKQAVYTPLIPRHPIAEVSTRCVQNQTSGQRKVQVVRGGVVRDVAVQLLGQVGVGRIYVSGTLSAADEIIVRASQQLPDGTRIRPSTATRTASRPAGPGSEVTKSVSSVPKGKARKNIKKKKTKSGF